MNDCIELRDGTIIPFENIDCVLPHMETGLRNVITKAGAEVIVNTSFFEANYLDWLKTRHLKSIRVDLIDKHHIGRCT